MVRALAAMFDALAAFSVAVDCSPALYCVDAGFQVLAAVAARTSGTCTTTGAEACTVAAFFAVKLAVFVRVWPSNDFAMSSGTLTTSWTVPVAPAASPVLAGVVLGTTSPKTTFMVPLSTETVPLPPTTVGVPTTVSGAGSGSVIVASTQPVVVDEQPKLRV